MRSCAVCHHWAILLLLSTTALASPVLPYRPSPILSGPSPRPNSLSAFPEDPEVYKPTVDLCPPLPARLSSSSAVSGDAMFGPEAAIPTSVFDLRPDDFDVIIALGDSITAGLMAERAVEVKDPASDWRLDREDGSSNEEREARRSSGHDSDVEGVLPRIRERRGVSYATGGDPGTTSLGRLIEWYRKQQGRTPGSTPHQPIPNPLDSTQEGEAQRTFTSPDTSDSIWPGRSSPPPHDRTHDTLLGLSYASHPPTTLTSHTPPQDGLNAALSGSTVNGLLGQVRGYVVPGLGELGVDLEGEKRGGRASWKLVTINIGANDLCSFCLSGSDSPKSTGLPGEAIGDPEGNALSFGPGSAAAFAETMKEVLEEIREEMPYTLVEIIGLFRVSAIYNLSIQNPHCTPFHLPPLFPQLPLECSCATVPGPVGDSTRAKMDRLGEEYDEAVKMVVKGIMDEQRARGKEGETFGVVWQPGTILDLSTYPSIPSLSPIDCFHPSEESHAHIAAGLWNTLTANEEGRRTKVPWWTDGKEGGDDEGGTRDSRPLIRCLREDDRIQL